MVQQMLAVNMPVILVQDNQGLTPLHLAALKNEQLNPLTALLENDNENESAVYIYIQDNEGRTALHFATLQCSWDGLMKLVSFCPDNIEMVDNKGQNVVHYAAKLGCLYKIKVVLNLECFDKLIFDKDMTGNTPLHLLAASDSAIPPHYRFFRLPHSITKTLLLATFWLLTLNFVTTIQGKKNTSHSRKTEMQPDTYSSAKKGPSKMQPLPQHWQNQTTPMGNTVLHVHLGNPRNKGNMKGKVNIEFIQTVLADPVVGRKMLLQGNTNGDTPLHLAARFGHEEAVGQLVATCLSIGEEVSTILKMANNKNDTALHEVARAGHASSMNLLLVAATGVGENPFAELLGKQNHKHETPLFLAVETGCMDLVNIILDKCDSSQLSIQGPCKQTALHAAIHWGNEDMVKNILSKDRSLVRQKDDKGLTPIHCAAGDITKTELLKVMLSYDVAGNSAVYIQDDKNRTALHLAVIQCNWQGLKELIKACPDSLEIVDDNGQNVVHYAAKLGCLCKFRTVLSLGGCDNLINDKDKVGNTPLHLLASVTPDIPLHRCFDKLERFIKRSHLDTKAHNDQDLTPGDIFATNKILIPHLLPRKNLTKVAPRGGRKKSYEGGNYDVEKADASVRLEKAVQTAKEAANHRLVIATLIATVSFAAGITLPGGLSQETGLAMLSKNTAFAVFLVSDSIAFICSSLAIICYFALSNNHSFFLIERYSTYGYYSTTVSLGALMVAFVMGVYTVVSDSPVLASGTIVISLFFFYHYARLLRRNFEVASSYKMRCNTKNLDSCEDRMNIDASLAFAQSKRISNKVFKCVKGLGLGEDKRSGLFQKIDEDS